MAYHNYGYDINSLLYKSEENNREEIRDFVRVLDSVLSDVKSRGSVPIELDTLTHNVIELLHSIVDIDSDCESYDKGYEDGKHDGKMACCCCCC